MKTCNSCIREAGIIANRAKLRVYRPGICDAEKIISSDAKEIRHGNDFIRSGECAAIDVAGDRLPGRNAENIL